MLSVALSAVALAGIQLDVGPVTAGGLAELLVTGCAPGAEVHFYRSKIGTGNGPCPLFLGGVCLDLKRPKDVGQQMCNAGSASLSVPVSPYLAPGARLAYQAVSYDGVVFEESAAYDRWIDAWWHEIAVDGSVTNEWLAGDEDFSTTSGLGTTWVTWDTDRLYVAAQHPDVLFGGPLNWLVIYVGDGVSGQTTGVTYGTQTPSFPVPMHHQVQWQANDDFNQLTSSDGVNWSTLEPFWLGTHGSDWAEYELEETVEFAIPWRTLGVGRSAVVYVGWLYEGAPYESTYAGVPATAFADGYNPTIGAVLSVDLASGSSPVLQNP